MIGTLALPDGTRVSRLGQGTWRMGERAGEAKQEEAALRDGVARGLTLIDTAEMYGDGGAERVVAAAIAGLRERVFLVSKFMPQHAGRAAVPRACAASLKRLGTDWLDLYLLHWRGGVPLAETVEALEGLRERGHIRAWGVSNFDVADMEELAAISPACATNQVLYNPEARGIEFDLLPYCATHRMPVMAYSPMGQGGRLLKSGALRAVAARHGASTAQIALAWALRQDGVIAIPKASDAAHVQANAAAAAITLNRADLDEIDAGFPPPRRKHALRML